MRTYTAEDAESLYVSRKYRRFLEVVSDLPLLQITPQITTKVLGLTTNRNRGIREKADTTLEAIGYF